MNLWQATAEMEAKRVKAKEARKLRRWRVWITEPNSLVSCTDVMATRRSVARAWAAKLWDVPFKHVAAVDDELFP